MTDTKMQMLKYSAASAHGVASLPDAQAGSKPHAIQPVAEEANFYNQYSWVLNAFPTIWEVLDHLSQELGKLEGFSEGWQQREVITNIFLLSCAVTDTIDDYLAGNTYDFSKIIQAFPYAALGAGILNRLCAGARKLREARLSRLRAWGEVWRSAVTDLLQNAMVGEPGQAVLAQQRAKLAGLLPPKFPKGMWNARPKMPAFFRSRDFASFDCLELGRKFIDRFPNGEKPTIIMGLRTAGSFLAPLLCAYLRTRLPAVDWVAVRPKKGLASWERAALRQAACRRARVLVIDESIHSGQTLITAITLLRQVGFKDDDIVVLNPAEPAFPDWKNSHVVESLPNIHTITLEPAERYKQRVLDSVAVEAQLKEYFVTYGYESVRLSASPGIEMTNAGWRTTPPERVDVRLKRLYEVQLRNAGDQTEIRHVLAKSVGWGWLGYHAFHAGQALAEFVPPMLGLRQGILYTEWLPQTTPAAVPARKTVTETLGSYVAARTRKLKFDSNPTPDLVREGRHKGLEMLATALSRAYGSRIAAAAQRPRIQEKLSQISRLSVLTDSKMAADEWIPLGPKLVKTDFEHHGQGKNELGMTDPAYDLADAIFQFGFSELEARQLIDEYVIESGDAQAEERLFLNKLLAGLWAQNLATLGLENPRLVSRRREFNEQYTSAWNFLVSETVRECAKMCRTADNVRWTSPLVVLDIDGVLDRMVFGFPSTTAAGIKALSLLANHGFTVALNTARTLHEVKEYCDAYGLAGGVAEYGGVAWDRVNNRQASLVDAESVRQLEEAQRALHKIPGVFLNEDYQYSLRAFTYQNGRTVPLPHLLVQDVLAGLKLDRLRAHHTGLDTAITSKETDKGKGLLALISLAELVATDVTAVGDSEPDLAMFRVVGRSFAPGNVSCRREAQLLGCQIAESAYQPGLLEIARRIIHPAGVTCKHCRDAESGQLKGRSLFVSLLHAADEKPLSLFLQNCLDPSILRLFRK
jgi:hydroxymethylpyrimidine pyrophosphatase-like HAD family hydrolase/hypoxanthine phosphoribosyltransferase